ncbi:DoxX family protein [Paraferrimonas sp. SM1919]|uniref:HvfX family Cu-binding RiPP maturation protein n=1 Tax=Paraferrimonas sp. SM1919 TaxID=2662263 RepID=UPI0013D8622D|nr:DoxX family protein [Paraferrimonas sp. SM1919]
MIPIEQQIERSTRSLSGLGPLLMRLYLAPIMIQAGWNKISNYDSTIAWFAEGLEIPFAEVLGPIAMATEFLGGILLLLGLAIRLITPPLMITMLVAAVTVHWQNGWLAIADASSWLANEQVLQAAEKLDKAKYLLQEHGNYSWLTSSGNFVVLNNGIEFAITYFVMLLSLFFTGGGRYFSIDHYRFLKR